MKFNQVQLARIAGSASLISAAFFAQTAPASPAKTTAPKTTITKSPSTRPRLSIRDVKSVFHRRALGNAYFTAQLRAELVVEGLKFVSDSKTADAILDTQGNYNGRAFSGQMKFYDRNGRLIWSQNVLRPANSNAMAYAKLSQALRAARR